MPWMIEAIAIAFTYVGTVVGAGFASGQEIYQFFLQDPTHWSLGVAVAAAVLLLLGVPLVRLGYEARDEGVAAALERWTGPQLAALIDRTISVFLFGGVCVMVAGGGAALQQVFGVPLWIGLLGMAIASWATVRAGIDGLKLANTLIVPLLIAITALVCVLARHATSSPLAAAALPGAFSMRSGFMYAAYNTAMALPVVLSLGAAASDRRRATVGLLVGIGITVGLIIAVTATLRTAGQEPLAHQIPMLHIAGGLDPLLRLTYFAALLGEIYTTAIGSLFGAVQSLRDAYRIDIDVAAGSLGLLAFGLGYIGFARLVETLYPLFGLVMGALMATIFCRRAALFIGKRIVVFLR